jgi:cell division protein ZapA (FtsZ GTPase activity inhibitor)
MKRKVDVTVLGHRFTVRTEKDEAYVHGLAAQITRRIEDVRRQMRNASREEQALLVALHLADELLEQTERSAAARAEVRRHTEAMILKLSQALSDSAPLTGARAMVTSDVEDDSAEVAVAQRQA